jgi:hypothetical protein
MKKNRIRRCAVRQQVFATWKKNVMVKEMIVQRINSGKISTWVYRIPAAVPSADRLRIAVMSMNAALELRLIVRRMLKRVMVLFVTRTENFVMDLKFAKGAHVLVPDMSVLTGQLALKSLYTVLVVVVHSLLRGEQCVAMILDFSSFQLALMWLRGETRMGAIMLSLALPERFALLLDGAVEYGLMRRGRMGLWERLMIHRWVRLDGSAVPMILRALEILEV